MTKQERLERSVAAWHDGELSWLGRRRMARRLARDPEARRALADYRAIGAALREAAGAEPEATPDLWPAIAARLPAAAPPRTRRARRALGLPRLGPWLAAPIGAVAALMLVWALATRDVRGDAPAPSLRWLRASDQPAMVLQDDREATIIWVFEAAPQVSGRFHSALG